MKILILGGTGFVGRILTENLIKAGRYDLTLFNRGSKNNLFPEVKKLTGDRYKKEDIDKIKNYDWDVIIDFSGHQPDNSQYILDIIKGKTGRYIFVSSASVYFTESMKIPLTEDSDILPCSEDQRKSSDIMTNFGQKKAEIDRIMLQTDSIDTIIFRPALIYGRYDPTDRFYYWLYRACIDKVMMPDNGESLITNTYSEDFAKILEEAINIKKHRKLYNATTHEPKNIAETLKIASQNLDCINEAISVPGEYIINKGIQPWTDIPLWIGDTNLVLDNTRMKEDFSNVKLTNYEDSIKESIDYYRSLGWPEPKYGLPLSKEHEVISEYINANQNSSP